MLTDGTEARYEVDENIPLAVATLVLQDSTVLLARQYLYPTDRRIYGLLGGAGYAGETPAEAASREPEEKLGFVADDLRPLYMYTVNPAATSALLFGGAALIGSFTDYLRPPPRSGRNDGSVGE